MPGLVLNPNFAALPADVTPTALHLGMLRQIPNLKRAWLADAAYTSGGVTCLPELLTKTIARPSQGVQYQPQIAKVNGRKALTWPGTSGAGCGMFANVPFDFADAYTLYFVIAPTGPCYLLGDDDFNRIEMRIALSDNPAGEIETRHKWDGTGAKSDAATAAFNQTQSVMIAYNSIDKRIAYARNGMLQAADAMPDAPINAANPMLFAQQPNLDNAFRGTVYAVLAFASDHAISANASDRSLINLMLKKAYGI